jgi:uncharacterized protein (TIGR00299 family) protein
MPDLLFEMHAGISGDMILGALFDMGLDFSSWNEQMKRLDLEEVSIKKEKVHRNSIEATRVTITAPKQTHSRNLNDIKNIIKRSRFPETVKQRSNQIFTNLAQAEAKIHGCDIDSVHFHEIGGVDTIVDITGACLGFEMLGVQNFHATPFTFGCGEVSASHGTLPVPAPASLELAKGFPVRHTQIQGELCTPTGTAIVTTLAKPGNAYSPCIIRKIGLGAGSREIKGIPNILRLSLIEVNPAATEIEPDEEIHQVECNLDDCSPEILGYLTGQLLEAGCADVWQESIFMKKNRAAIKLCALAENQILKKTLQLITRETSTGGVRYFPVKRIVSQKALKSIKTKYGEIQVKKSQFNEDMGNIIRYIPEYESCRKLAQRHEVPLQLVYSEALSILNENDL